jgi:hypothetical protein
VTDPQCLPTQTVRVLLRSARSCRCRVPFSTVSNRLAFATLLDGCLCVYQSRPVKACSGCPRARLTPTERVVIPPCFLRGLPITMAL